VGSIAKYCFGHELILLYRGRQRRDAVAAGEEQLGGCAAGQSKYYRFYLLSVNLILTNFGVGLRRPCRGQACCGMFGAMTRIAPARPATPRSTNKYSKDRFSKYSSTTVKNCEWKNTTQHAQPDHKFFHLAQGLNSDEFRCSVAAFVVNSQPHTG
jgi:hypothetical protein